MKRLLILVLVAIKSFASWDDMATAAAMGYCLTKHPYKTIHKGNYTPDGYEIVSRPGIIGAVRRNFVFNRNEGAIDEGFRNKSCTQACSEFGKKYSGKKGVPLKQKNFW